MTGHHPRYTDHTVQILWWTAVVFDSWWNIDIIQARIIWSGGGGGGVVAESCDWLIHY